MRPSCPRTPTD
ncbi:hypothetical protein EYF80_067715 [Liparis tanakae]|uniref:Uncharacterized protein n=1 Tax=Liparis tanakae TaxID=230148 RepID=A0A4Z2E050_9TELE|nr:hypothetical protein EYF80_067715 [Liparis tanakae]